MDSHYSITSIQHHFYPQAFPHEADHTQQPDANEGLLANKLGASITGGAVGLACTKADGTFTYVNRRYCDMLGYEATELIGRTMQEITHPADLEYNLDLFNRLGHSGDAFEIEKRYFCKDR